MAWTNPRTWVIGEKVTKAIMDLHIRDNLIYLKGLLDLGYRQGGNATNWPVRGSTNYSVTGLKIQTGCAGVAVTTSAAPYFTGSVSVTFPEVFSANPLVFVTVQNTLTPKIICPMALNFGVGGFLLYCTSDVSAIYDVAWFAVGAS